MTDTVDTRTPMEKMLMECNGDPDILGERISAVLEFLTLRAAADAPYMVFTDTEDAMVLFAAGDITNDIRDRLTDLNIKRWEDELDPDANIDEFLTDADPGDEQDEPAPAA